MTRTLYGYRVSGGELHTVCSVDYYQPPRWSINALEAARQYQRRDGGTITALWMVEEPTDEPKCSCRYWVDDHMIGHEARDPACPIKHPPRGPCCATVHQTVHQVA